MYKVWPYSSKLRRLKALWDNANVHGSTVTLLWKVFRNFTGNCQAWCICSCEIFSVNLFSTLVLIGCIKKECVWIIGSIKILGSFVGVVIFTIYTLSLLAKITTCKPIPSTLIWNIYLTKKMIYDKKMGLHSDKWLGELRNVPMFQIRDNLYLRFQYIIPYYATQKKRYSTYSSWLVIQS